jgi:hypothetical protein
MLRIKNNLVSANRAGLSYSVVTKLIPIKGEPDLSTPYVIWGKVIEGSADEALARRGGQQSEPSTPRGPGRPSDKLLQATKFLEDYLQDGRPHESAVVQDVALHEGPSISKDTLDRAYNAMPGHKKAFQGAIVGSGRKRNCWFWQIEPMNEGNTQDMEPQESSLINYGDSD